MVTVLLPVVADQTWKMRVVRSITTIDLLVELMVNLAIEVGECCPVEVRVIGVSLSRDLLRRKAVEPTEVGSAGRVSISMLCCTTEPTLNANRVEEATTRRYTNNSEVLVVISLIATLLLPGSVNIFALYKIILTQSADLRSRLLDRYVANDVAGDEVGHPRQGKVNHDFRFSIFVDCDSCGLIGMLESRVRSSSTVFCDD
jgi:hypothetical protein